MANHPLPSWNDSAAKSVILDFVARVTKEGGPRLITPRHEGMNGEKRHGHSQARR
jgi:hypothetical protein